MPDPALAALLAARKAERAAAKPLPPPPDDAAADYDPPIDFGPPLSLAEVAELALGSGVAEADLPPATRAALEARRARTAALEPAAPLDTLPVRERARDALAEALPGLRRDASDAALEPSERAAAAALLARIADAYGDAGAVALRDRALSTLTHAELMQRVAECDQRRAQLLARIGADTPAPARPRGKRRDAGPAVGE